MKIETAF